MNKITAFLKSAKLKYILFVYFCVFSGALFFLFIGGSTWIGYEVQEQCRRAAKVYKTDSIDALSHLVRDTQNTLDERNSAVWALGQMGDKRALPVLKEFYTGGECDHERHLCQHELKKAIKLCEGGFNITAIVWRKKNF